MLLSVLSARNRRGTERLVTPSGISRAANSVVSCRPSVSGHRSRSSKHTRGQSRETLVDYLAAWKLLPNVSRWVLQTVEKGYRIQFGAPPPPFKGIFLTLVSPKQALHLILVKRSDAARGSQRGTSQVTYVTMVPRGNETLRRGAILPASLLELCFFPRSWRRLHVLLSILVMTSPAPEVLP